MKINEITQLLELREPTKNSSKRKKGQFPGDDKEATFIGRKATMYDVEKEKLARKMEKQGYSRDEIYELKRLAGIIDREGKKIQSTDESNISITGSAKKKIEREKNIQPGTEEWFKLWFSRPYMMGQPRMK